MTGTSPTLKLAEYIPLPWQVEPWRDTSETMLLTGSAGGGKSRLAAEKLHGFCLKYPGAMALAARKTRESMVNSTVLVLEKRIIGADVGVRHNQSKNRFEYSNGSILAYGGMKDDAQRQQIRSIGQDGGLDIAWLEEANAFTEADFNEILARMRGKAAHWRQIILSTNPDAPTHWIYKRLIEGREATVHKSRAADNRHNPASYEATLQKMTGVQKDRLADGQWVQAEGSVWPGFDSTIHVIPPFKIPDDWQRRRSIDFGFKHPFSCLFAAIDHDKTIYIYREWKRCEMIVSDHAEKIKQLTGSERIFRTVADHDAEDRATLARAGIQTVPAYKAVERGLQNVDSRWRVQANGKARLYIFEDSLVSRCPILEAQGRPLSLAEEIPGYVWEKSADGKPLKEEPHKDNDDSCDALRYLAASVDNLAGTNVTISGGAPVAV